MIETLITAAEQIEAVLPKSQGIQDVVADKGLSQHERVVDLQGLESEVLFPNPKDLAVAGRETRKRKRLFMQTGVEYVVGVGKLSSASGGTGGASIRASL